VNKAYIDRYKADNFYYIPNAIDIKLFKFLPKQKPQNTIKLFFPNLSTSANKNINFAIEILKILNNRSRKSKYILQHCGDKYNNDNCVMALGDLTRCEMVQAYHNSDFSIIPSLSESCSLCLLESFSTGCYPLASDIIGLREYSLKQYRHIFSLTNPLEWVMHIEKLLDNWELYNEAVENAQRHIARDYSIERMVNQYRKIWSCFLNEELNQ
jgi:glycosyltransferase involved in cell wall biosynthesis